MKQDPTMVSLIDDYLAARRQMGFALEIAGTQLQAFARFADAAEHRGPVTVALKRYCEGVWLVAMSVECAVAAIRFGVAKHPGVVRKLAGEDR